VSDCDCLPDCGCNAWPNLREQIRHVIADEMPYYVTRGDRATISGFAADEVLEILRAAGLIGAES
jgi:pSer/pThr/pTyr-binding forkhead associated (FHA) protein